MTLLDFDNNSPNTKANDPNEGNGFISLRTLFGLVIGGTTLYFSYQYFDRDTFNNMIESIRNQLSDIIPNNLFTSSGAMSIQDSTSSSAGLSWDFLQNIFYENKLLFFLIICGLVLLIILYYRHQNTTLINEIFEEIEKYLKTNGENCVIAEEEIVNRYSVEYNYEASYFRSKILPALEERRKKSGKIKKDEEDFNGINKLAWIYIN